MFSVISFVKQSAKSDISDLFRKTNKQTSALVLSVGTVTTVMRMLLKSVGKLSNKAACVNMALVLSRGLSCHPLRQVLMVDVVGHNHQEAEELAEKNRRKRRVDLRHSHFI